MFFAEDLLSRKTPLGRVWAAAHTSGTQRLALDSKGLTEAVDALLNPREPLALRLTGHLLCGIVRIHTSRVQALYDKCNKHKLATARRSAHAIDMDPTARANVNAPNFGTFAPTDGLDFDIDAAGFDAFFDGGDDFAFATPQGSEADFSALGMSIEMPRVSGTPAAASRRSILSVRSPMAAQRDRDDDIFGAAITDDVAAPLPEDMGPGEEELPPMPEEDAFDAMAAFDDAMPPMPDDSLDASAEGGVAGGVLDSSGASSAAAAAAAPARAEMSHLDELAEEEAGLEAAAAAAAAGKGMDEEDDGEEEGDGAGEAGAADGDGAGAGQPERKASRKRARRAHALVDEETQMTAVEIGQASLAQYRRKRTVKRRRTPAALREAMGAASRSAPTSGAAGAASAPAWAPKDKALATLARAHLLSSAPAEVQRLFAAPLTAGQRALVRGAEAASGAEAGAQATAAEAARDAAVAAEEEELPPVADDFELPPMEDEEEAVPEVERARAEGRPSRASVLDDVAGSGRHSSASRRASDAFGAFRDSLDSAGPGAGPGLSFDSSGTGVDDLGIDVGDITVRSAASAADAPAAAAATAAGMHRNTAIMLAASRRCGLAEEGKTTTFSDLVGQASRTDAARAFLQLLFLKTAGALEGEQESPFADIHISKADKFDEMCARLGPAASAE